MAMKPVKVSQLNGYIKRILQSDPLLGNVSVIGEISNLKYHGTGHVYFTLKDETSKINCFLSAENLKDLRYELADGMEIIANGYIYLYERGGTYSLNVRQISVEGVGNLSAAFEKLKEKLMKEGLFDEKYKKPIPFFPEKVAIVTSETGAAVQDMMKIIQGRNKIVDILIYPCLVQGPGAAAEISQAIDGVNRLFPEVDIIITGRGGGSMEELWAFNEEVVARSIFASKIPIISAVGHETDFTIADFVADKRAETPTAAAQMAVPDIQALKTYIHDKKHSLAHNMDQRIKYMELRVKAKDMDALYMDFVNKTRIYDMETTALYNEMNGFMEQRLSAHHVAIDKLFAALETLNPKNIMERGYAAILDKKGKLTGTVEGLASGDQIRAVFKDGEALCQVEDIRRDSHVRTKEIEL